MSKTPDQLPPKPSDLLQLAIDDAMSVDRNIYVPNHLYYHQGANRKTCHICIAGSVIANTIKFPHNQETTPAKLLTDRRISDKDAQRLLAIDLAQSGLWTRALDNLDINPDNTPGCQSVAAALEAKPNSHRDFRSWSEFDLHLDYIRSAIGVLRANGL